MTTILHALQGVTSYPIPENVAEQVCLRCGLNPNDPMTYEMRNDKDIKRALSYIYYYLSTAPDVTQGGISYRLDSATRSALRSRSTALLNEAAEEEAAAADLSKPAFGYMGENL